MNQQSQIHSVIVKINMDGTENHPRFVVEEVKAQSGPCFEGAANLLRARFECLCCKTGYAVLPLITKTKPTWMQMEVSIAENFPTAIQETVEPATEGETGRSLDMAHDSDVEPKQGDEFVDIEMEADQALREVSIDIGPLEHQSQVDQMTDLEKEVFGRTRMERSLDDDFDSDEELKQGDGDEDSEAETKMIFPMVVDPNSFKTQSVMYEAHVEEAREIVAPVVPVEAQDQDIEGGFYTCDICNASIKHRRHLPTHMKTHMGIRYTCSECSKSFSQKSVLNKHKKNLHQSEFRICQVCNRSQTCTKAEYYSHLRRRHPEFHKKGLQQKEENFNGVDFPCVYCEPQATFNSFDKLKKHLRVTHDRNFACTRCPKALCKSSDLKYHIKIVHQKVFSS